MSFELNLTRIAEALEAVAASLAQKTFATTVNVAADPSSAPAVPAAADPSSAPAPAAEPPKRTRAKKETAPAPTMPAETPAGHLQAANPNPAGTGTFAAITPISPAAFAALPAVKQEALAAMQQNQAVAQPVAQPAAAAAIPLDSAVLGAVAAAPMPAFAPPAAAAFTGYDAVLTQYHGALLPSQVLPAETVAQLGRWDSAFSAAAPVQQMEAINQLFMEFIGNPAIRESLERSLAWFGQALPISKGAAAPNEPGDAWVAMPVNQRFIVYLQAYLTAEKLRAAAAPQPAGV